MKAFLTVHWPTILSITLAVLPSLITGASNYPRTASILRILLDALSVVAHRDSPHSLKFPLTRSRAPWSSPPTLLRNTLKKVVGVPPIKPFPAATIRIAIVDFGNTGVDPSTLPAVAAALSRQVNEHFAAPPPRGYGIRAEVRAAKGIHDQQPGEWILGLFEKPDIADALGYHDETPQGTPVMKAFPRLDAEGGTPWTVTASHEVLECLADPNLCKAAQGSDGKFWAYEVCDAVEGDTYEIDGVKVSDFVLPLYFEPLPGAVAVHAKDGLRYDYLGLIRSPLEIRPTGYGQYFDCAGNGWQQVMSQRVSAARRRDRGGRRERRREHMARHRIVRA